jgi:hypothetical protein
VYDYSQELGLLVLHEDRIDNDVERNHSRDMAREETKLISTADMNWIGLLE